jgi:Glycosyl hydrolase catalytic core
MRRAIILATLAASLLLPSTAAAARSEFFGIVQTATLDARDLQGMFDARVRTDRFVFKWGWVQPNPGSFDWDSADQFIGELAYHRIRAVPSLWGNPDWVAGGSSTPPIYGDQAEQAWRTFLRAVVGRYGPGGTFWAAGGPYRQRYGPNAKPLGIKSYQVWNEPNLDKYFAPSPSPGKYARLLQISHAAIKSKYPKARVVLAGMPSRGDVDAWDFLRDLYAVTGIKGRFDATALHPYGPTIDGVRKDIQRFRAVMGNHGDGATPLWISELAWGSAPPDDFGINKGIDGQARMLRRAYNLILDHRRAWRVDRLFWYHWRDPHNPVASCSFCGSAGLVWPGHGLKPAHGAFIDFTAETDRPQATITSGPIHGGATNDPTPTFSFTSDEHGSTFVCRVGGGSYRACSSPHTLSTLSDGLHAFFVKAIDAPGNESPFEWRYFTVDTQAPAAPQITSFSPNSPANDNQPEAKGTSESGTTVKLYKTAGCTGPQVAQGSASKFASPGITVTVPDNSTTYFRAKARDGAGNVSPCSAARRYIEDSTP